MASGCLRLLRDRGAASAAAGARDSGSAGHGPGAPARRRWRPVSRGRRRAARRSTARRRSTADCRISTGYRAPPWRTKRVVESFIGAGAVLPMKLFTIFTSDERALEHVRAQRKRHRHAGRSASPNHEEWGVRVVLDRTRAERRAGAAGVRQRPDRRGLPRAEESAARCVGGAGRARARNGRRALRSAGRARAPGQATARERAAGAGRTAAARRGVPRAARAGGVVSRRWRRARRERSRVRATA